jgi:hypothetical protein
MQCRYIRVRCELKKPCPYSQIRVVAREGKYGQLQSEGIEDVDGGQADVVAMQC